MSMLEIRKNLIRTRPDTVNIPEVLEMLRFQASRMVVVLDYYGINLRDGAVCIWIKQFNYNNGQIDYYPKIEFDYNGQELQYDIDINTGRIKETYFKYFEHVGYGVRRADIMKENADPLLQKIDDILRWY